MIEISVEDPGAGSRLGATHQKTLRDDVRKAKREGASAVLIKVEADAWSQDDENGPYAAADVTSGPHALIGDLFSLDVPVIAMLEGKVRGLGLTLALIADVRFAHGNSSFAIGHPESAHGVYASTTWLLAERTGSAIGSHLAWTGRSLTAQMGLDAGLLSGITNDGAEAQRLATRLAALPSATTSTLKRSTTARLRAGFREQLDYDSWLAQAATQGETI